MFFRLAVLSRRGLGLSVISEGLLGFRRLLADMLI